MIIEQHDWDKGKPIRLEVNDQLVEDFLNWMMTTTRWQEDPDFFQKRYRAFKSELLATAHPGEDAAMVTAPTPKKKARGN